MLCVSLLYGPYVVLCIVGATRHPVLLVLSLFVCLASFCGTAFVSLFFVALRAVGVSDAALSVSIIGLQFGVQIVLKIGLLIGCILLQRRQSLVAVRCSYQLLPLSVAIGSGFGAASVLLSGGPLLAASWSTTSSTAAAVAEKTSSLVSVCPQLSLVMRSCFQQLFYSYNQIAWTVMLGQFSSACLQWLSARDEEGDEPSYLPMLQATPMSHPVINGRENEASGVAGDAAREAGSEDDRTCTAAALPSGREEMAATDSPVDLIHTDEKDAVVKSVDPAAPLVSPPLLGGSIIHGTAHVMGFSGLAAFFLHFSFMSLSVLHTGGALTAAAAESDAGAPPSCNVLIPLQCGITLASVAWGLWICTV